MPENYPLEGTTESEIGTRSLFNQYFDWDWVEEIPIPQYPYGIDLPWAEGSQHASGIPDDWIDEKAFSTTYAERKYSRENGWFLVYSNMGLITQTNKFFALYNENTGILRFFFFSLSDASLGTSASFIGIGTTTPTTLFNYTESYAGAMDRPKAAPSYVFSPKWTLSNSGGSSIGYNDQQWYGIEIECAYDPSLITTSAKIKTRVWGADYANITGTGVTTGTINGTISQATGNNPSLSLNFTNNANSRTVTNNYNQTLDEVSQKVEASGEFGEKLWENVKTEYKKLTNNILNTGIKEGLKLIATQGGSLATKAFGGMFNSIIGKSSEPQVQKVELTMSSNTQFSATSITEHLGFGNSTPFPLPGTISTDLPIYTLPLGVWNLEETPQLGVITNATGEYNQWGYFCKGRYSKYYYLQENTVKIKLNPVIEARFDIQNIKKDLMIDEGVNFRPALNVNNYRVYIPTGIIEETKWYRVPNNALSTLEETVWEEDAIARNHTNTMLQHFRVRVSFDLVNKTNANEVYSFSKYFYVVENFGEIYLSREQCNDD